MQFWKFQTCPKTCLFGMGVEIFFVGGEGAWKIGMHFSFNIPVTMQFQKFCRPAQKAQTGVSLVYFVFYLFV